MLRQHHLLQQQCCKYASVESKHTGSDSIVQPLDSCISNITVVIPGIAIGRM
jgi:hypothetical protein